MPDGIQGQGSAPPDQIAQFRSDGFSGNTGLRAPFFSDAFSRAFGFPDVRLVNLISESTPVREERPYAAYVGLREVHYSRPGLIQAQNYGTGPIRGLYFDPAGGGLGSLFVVAGATIYRNGGSVGTLPGNDLVRFAASPSQVVAVAGGYAYLWDGVNFPSFTLINNNVLPNVSDVAYLAGRFVFTDTGSAQWTYSEVNDAGNETGLDFANNNVSAAPNVAVRVLNDKLAFFTTTNVEFWSANTDVSTAATTPFLPDLSGGYQRGAASRDTVCFADNALFWVGDNGVVYRSGGEPTRISSSSIGDKLRQCPNWASLSAFVVGFEGHEFYVLNIPGVGTYAYDISRVGTIEGSYGDSYARGEWAQWSSWNRDTFRCKTAAVFHESSQPPGGNQATFVGDDTTGEVWEMKVGAWTDGGPGGYTGLETTTDYRGLEATPVTALEATILPAGDPLIRQACAFIKIEEGRPRMDSLVLHCVTGVGNAVDPGSAPIVEMSWSDDMGRTWERWRQARLGAMGDYTARCSWQRLGVMRAPGRLIRVRCSEPVDVAFSHLELNPLRPAQ
jgi:hypothetical protein